MYTWLSRRTRLIRIEPEGVHKYAKDIAARIVASNPKRYPDVPGVERRVGKLFIDHLRNGRGCTAVGAWSPRARMGLPIARPVKWVEIEKGTAAASSFTLLDQLKTSTAPRTRR